MAKCCICGRRIGGLGEDKYKITEEYIACYQCAPYFRKMKDAENSEQILKNENEINIKLEVNDASQDVKDAVENEIQKIKDNKQDMYRKEQFQLQKKDEIRKKRKEFMMTTGYNFEGYKIIKYINLVYGEIVLGTGFYSELSASISDLLGVSSKTFEGKISQAKGVTQEQMILNAMTMDANAIIGIDFDITTFSNNMIGVSANGTAVVIEKID